MEFLNKLDHQELFGLSVVILVGLVGAIVVPIAIITTGWRRVRVAEMELALKQQMLEKGMSATEIEQVMRTLGPPPATPPPVMLGNEIHDKATLVQHLVDNGYAAEDIERVLKAYQSDSNVHVDRVLANVP